jgi:hypothetical protein
MRTRVGLNFSTVLFTLVLPFFGIFGRSLAAAALGVSG